jgi:hypothetical protein
MPIFLGKCIISLKCFIHHISALDSDWREVPGLDISEGEESPSWSSHSMHVQSERPKGCACFATTGSAPMFSQAKTQSPTPALADGLVPVPIVGPRPRHRGPG